MSAQPAVYIYMQLGSFFGSETAAGTLVDALERTRTLDAQSQVSKARDVLKFLIPTRSSACRSSASPSSFP